eukprot:m.140545 g.140545  ORF g.140545 m.140545 type:complete len:135 (-) comp22805_c1_seq1:143-547(-)
MAPTITEQPTPPVDNWVGLIGTRVLNWGDAGRAWFKYTGETHAGFPVYSCNDDYANNTYTIYREGNMWYYTPEPNDRFNKEACKFVSQIAHDVGSDPNLPPTGRGWTFADNAAQANPELFVSLADDFNIALQSL